MAGKGDTPRAVNGSKYRANFDLIFPKKKSCSAAEVADICQQMTTEPSTPAVSADDGHEA
jgi:hypothetical protein